MKLIDVHNDLLTQKENFNEYLDNFNKELKAVILAIFLSENHLSVEEIISLTKEVVTNKKVYFAIEDISSLCYEDLTKLKEIKPLYCSLTWNHKNSLAGGAYSRGTLTKLGKKYMDLIERFSYVDTSHLNKKSFFKVAKYSKKPLLNSHTNLNSFYKHKRNLTDKQVKKIIKSNGLVCLTGVKEFLGKDANLDTYVNSLYHFYLKFGANNLAIASDFMGSDEFPLTYKNYSDFKTIYALLKKKGLNEEELAKIFYSNVIDFFKLQTI